MKAHACTRAGAEHSVDLHLVVVSKHSPYLRIRMTDTMCADKAALTSVKVPRTPASAPAKDRTTGKKRKAAPQEKDESKDVETHVEVTIKLPVLTEHCATAADVEAAAKVLEYIYKGKEALPTEIEMIAMVSHQRVVCNAFM